MSAATSIITSFEEVPKMEYVYFGKTGLRVCLGCMSYDSSKYSPWDKGKEDSIKAIKEAYELGGDYSLYTPKTNT